MDKTPMDICWETGRYTDTCVCELCDYKDVCSGHYDEDDEEE